MREPRRLRGGDDRGVSTAVGYTLTLGITALLISGLVIAAGGMVADQRDRAARSELGVYGQRIAGGVADADRLVAAADAGGDADVPDTVRVRVALPDRAAGRAYAVAVRNVTSPGDGPPYAYRIVLASDAANARVTVGIGTRTPLAETRLSGGTLAVALRDADDGSGPTLTLEVG